MKKSNFVFLGECVIIFSLLILVTVLVKTDSRATEREEAFGAIKEVVIREEVTQENVVKEDVEQKEILLEEMTRVEAEILEEESMEAEISAQTVSEQVAISENSIDVNVEDKVEIVVFGDSIWYTHDEEVGIPALIMDELEVEIYNCSIGGTTAAVTGDSRDVNDWTSNSFNGMMYIVRGEVDGEEIIAQDKAYEVLQKVDFNEVDYVIVSYGLNDYFCDVPVYPKSYYDMTSYVGALRHGIHKLQKEYPHLEFILTSPTYCEWFKGERQYDVGTYVEAARSVADEMELHFLDMYHALGKTPDEKTEYLSDGVHLNQEGKKLYAHSVIECLKELGVKEKNNK